MKDLICIIPVSNFNDSKTRLSPLLSQDERKELLKAMLKDIINEVRSHVYDIVLVSNDDEVFEYANDLGISFHKEKDYDDNKLNNALIDAIKTVKLNYDDLDILVIPSDIPLINSNHVISAHESTADLVISPSRGGGTNLLCFNSDFDFTPLFGQMSYFRHVEEAYTMGMDVNVIESFYLSLDVNTKEDLGEILLHAVSTNTYEYLSKLNISVKSSHGQERLDVKRNDE
ncbi:MAG: 2-phospho-L-lactate guanylyltransferase [Methanosphaera sp. rholeuAM130]|nr:2-phospho-L-lactate guanylyltransferase [Methanosphaera sp.]RAP51952.1 MAG: 2-phospho-L-lactate guanylyltransferase [Methanosphaera sp. rholeuAM130]